jgi:ribosomal protein S27AE
MEKTIAKHNGRLACAREHYNYFDARNMKNVKF